MTQHNYSDTLPYLGVPSPGLPTALYPVTMSYHRIISLANLPVCSWRVHLFGIF